MAKAATRVAKKSSKSKTGKDALDDVGATAADAGQGPSEGPANRWTFLTNHTHVLILLAQNETIVLRDVASQIGITERAVQRIIAELESGGCIERHKVGRQNQYRIISDRPLRHPIEQHRTIGDLLRLILT